MKNVSIENRIKLWPECIVTLLISAKIIKVSNKRRKEKQTENPKCVSQLPLSYTGIKLVCILATFVSILLMQFIFTVPSDL